MYHLSSGAGLDFPELHNMETLSPNSQSDFSSISTGPSDGGTEKKHCNFTHLVSKTHTEIQYLKPGEQEVEKYYNNVSLVLKAKIASYNYATRPKRNTSRGGKISHDQSSP